MKMTFLKTLGMLALSAVLLVSCKKDSDGSGSTTVPSGKSEVKFSYTGAASGSFASNLTMSTVQKNSTLINISASYLSGTTPHMVLFILPANIAAGNYTQGADGTVGGAVFSFNILGDGWTVDGGGATGFRVNITKNDATGIEGTFSGELGNDSDNTKINTSNGTFKASF